MRFNHLERDNSDDESTSARRNWLVLVRTVEYFLKIISRFPNVACITTTFTVVRSEKKIFNWFRECFWWHISATFSCRVKKRELAYYRCYFFAANGTAQRETLIYIYIYMKKLTPNGVLFSNSWLASHSWLIRAEKQKLNTKPIDKPISTVTRFFKKESKYFLLLNL